MFIHMTFPKINEVPGQYCWTIVNKKLNQQYLPESGFVIYFEIEIVCTIQTG
jgi:hypothetical protein